MPRNPSFFAILAMALVAGWVLLSAAGCGEREGSRNQARAAGKEAAAKAAPPRRPTRVEALRIVRRDFELTAGYVGHLLPHERVVLRAEIEGVAERVSFTLGGTVRKGQVLAHISTAQRRVRVELSRADLRLAQANFARNRDLKAKNLISPAQLDESRNRRDVARFTLKLAEIELSKSTVSSPIAGAVKARGVEPGEFLNKGQLIAEILDLARMRVKMNVPEREIRYFSVGKPARISVDALDEGGLAGQVSMINPEADMKTRTFEVEVALDNARGRLRSGMLARVTVALARHRGKVLIPRHAVLERENGRVAFVAANGIAEQRNIQTGVSVGNEVHVTGGLEAGEWVIVAGHRKLTPGEAVQVANRNR